MPNLSLGFFWCVIFGRYSSVFLIGASCSVAMAFAIILHSEFPIAKIARIVIDKSYPWDRQS